MLLKLFSTIKGKNPLPRSASNLRVLKNFSYNLYFFFVFSLLFCSYTENAKMLAAIFKDRPITVMDNAIYWTEYVLKYKGAYHLRSAAVKLPWYSEYLLDVFSFIILVFSVSVYVLWKLLAVCCKVCRRDQGRTKKKEKGKKEKKL